MADQNIEDDRADNLSRYIEHMQRQMLPEGLDAIFCASNWADWTSRNLARLSNLAHTSDPVERESLVSALERQASAFRPLTSLELPNTEAVFGPLFRDLSQQASKLGIGLSRDVRIATSTAIDTSPRALPSQGEHILFIGLGTSSFCNYWAKAYAAIVKAISSRGTLTRVSSSEELERALKQHPSGLLLACRLALHYATFGSVIGFGEVVQPQDYFPYRMQLLVAMESFAVAHEFAHFAAEERLPHLTGQLDIEDTHRLEYFCDSLGITLSRNCDSATDNWLAFTGTGAIVLLRAIQLSESFRQRLQRVATNELADPSTHPTVEDRVACLKSRIVSSTADDQRQHVVDWLDEYDFIAKSLNAMALRTLEVALQPS